MEQKVLRMGTVVITGALLLRLLSAASFGNALKFTMSPRMASFLVFLQTGRLVRPSNITFTPPPDPTEESEETPPPPVSVPTFSAQDADAIKINSSFSHSADVSALLTKPLSWDLTADAPTVLILHTHATEAFSGGGYSPTSAYHTLDTQQNMVSIGAHLADLLHAGGIQVLQDAALHDTPSYNASYNNSRESIQKYLQEYPSIRLVLDLHRDSIEDAAGNQVAQTVFSQGTALAPLMFVVGTDEGGLTHPQWQENLSLALKLQTQLESLCPGICRNINLRTQRFNQDLSPGALLIEVGASGNTHAQALLATEMLAESILSLAHGSQ